MWGGCLRCVSDRHKGAAERTEGGCDVTLRTEDGSRVGAEGRRREARCGFPAKGDGDVWNIVRNSELERVRGHSCYLVNVFTLKAGLRPSGQKADYEGGGGEGGLGVCVTLLPWMQLSIRGTVPSHDAKALGMLMGEAVTQSQKSEHKSEKNKFINEII